MENIIAGFIVTGVGLSLVTGIPLFVYLFVRSFRAR